MTINEKRAPLPVLLMIDRLGVAGTEKWLQRLIDGIDKAAIKPHLCLLDGLDAESQRLKPIEYPTLCLGLRSFWTPQVVPAIRRLRRFIREHQIQVVQVHFPDSTFFGATVAWSAGVRRIIGTMRNTGYWANGWQRRRMKLAGRFLNRVIANSQASASAAKSLFGLPDSQIELIYNGIDVLPFQGLPQPRLTKPDKEKWRIGIIANLREVKDLGTFVSAAIGLLKQRSDVEFVIVGEGPERPALEQQIANAGYSNEIRLLGQTNNVREVLASFDVATLTSKTEGLSNAVMEYMAASRPIVVSAVGGNLELIEAEVTGLHFTCGDIQGLMQKISALLDDRNRAVELGSKAKQTICLKFDKSAEVERYTHLWSNCH